MSENNSFLHPLWNAFGPSVCLPHLIQQGCLYSGRVYYDEGGWLADSDGITLPLAQIADPGARANLGIKLAYKRDDNSWDYYIEYVQPTGWNTGLLKPYVFIRRIGTVIRDNFETPIFLGLIEVPATAGARAEFVELQGNVRFIVERFDPVGRILRIEAKKL